MNGQPFPALLARLRAWARRNDLLGRLNGFRKGRYGRPVGLALVALVAFGLLQLQQPQQGAKAPSGKTSISQLMVSLRQGAVKRLSFDPSRMAVTVTPRHGDPYQVGVPASQTSDRLERLAESKHVVFESKPLAASGGSRSVILSFLPQLLVLAFVGFFLMRVMGKGSRKVKEVANTSTVRFSDVAGCDEAVEELEDVREFLRNPDRFRALGAKIPKGVLLHGQPGTGKTLLAKAVANEAGVPFFSISGSEFVEMYAGLGAKRVRSLFAQAKKVAPAIVFIDELDAVGRSRSGGGDGGTREADQTLNQLLTEMDGFEISEAPVIVMATSNRPEMLDAALVRPGRFDRLIGVHPPDRRGRLDVLRIHAAGKPLASDVDLERIARETAQMTGADLANLLNEAALVAARRHASEITQADLDAAYMRVVAGPEKKNRVLGEGQRRKVAFHEAGHALVSELFPAARKLHKVSIIPRGESGGQAVYVSDEDVYLLEREELCDRICALLAGRAAEEAVYSRVSTGAADDLKKASEIVLRMVGEFGMGRTQGLLVRGDGKVEANSPAELEAKQLLDNQYERALKTVREHRDALDRVAEALLEEETLDRERFLALAELA